MPEFGHHFHIKLMIAICQQRINCWHQRREMYADRFSRAETQFTVKVPKVHAIGQRLGAFAFDVFADVVLAGVQQPIAIFAFDLK